MSDIEMLRQEIRELKAISLMSQKDALTVEEAIIYTGLSKQTIYNMCGRRIIPHYKSTGGKRIYFKKAELTAWMLGTKVNTESSIESEASRRSYLRN